MQLLQVAAQCSMLFFHTMAFEYTQTFDHQDRKSTTASSGDRIDMTKTRCPKHALGYYDCHSAECRIAVKEKGCPWLKE